MLWIPQKGRQRIINNSGIVGAVPATAIVASGTTLLDGAVTEFISAANNNQDSWGISIGIYGDVSPGTLLTETALDILIGGATDDVLIAALLCGGAQRGFAQNWFFPLHIPQGKRIAGILASVKVSMAYHVLITLHGGSPPPFQCGSKVDTLGTQVNNARGKAITLAASGAAAVVNEMIASTVYDYFAFMPGFQVVDATATTGNVNIGIGVGAATEDRIGTWWWSTSSNEDVIGPAPPFPAFCDVPAGTRMSILASNSIANDAAYDGLIYAVR